MEPEKRARQDDGSIDDLHSVGDLEKGKKGKDSDCSIDCGREGNGFTPRVSRQVVPCPWRGSVQFGVYGLAIVRDSVSVLGI